MSAGIIVAGWDKEAGPSVYNIPLGGGLFRQPWAIGGGCSVSTLTSFIEPLLLTKDLDQRMCTDTVMPHIKKAGDGTKPSIL